MAGHDMAGHAMAAGAERARREIQKKLVVLFVWAAAFAFVEAAVVVYLRRIFYPGGFAFPLKPEMLESILGVEIAREAATMIMLAATAWLADTRPWVRFGYFMAAFGIWDIFYYIWLWAVLGWPPSVFTLDVLFLIPIVWVGPVWSPVVVAAGLFGCGAAVAYRTGGGGVFRCGAGGVVGRRPIGARHHRQLSLVGARGHALGDAGALSMVGFLARFRPRAGGVF